MVAGHGADNPLRVQGGALRCVAMDLRLSDDEAAVVREVLSVAVREMKSEISATDNAEYRHALRARLEAMMTVLERLGGLAPPD
jgi:hypothetical protein